MPHNNGFQTFLQAGLPLRGTVDDSKPVVDQVKMGGYQGFHEYFENPSPIKAVVPHGAPAPPKHAAPH